MSRISEVRTESVVWRYRDGTTPWPIKPKTLRGDHPPHFATYASGRFRHSQYFENDEHLYDMYEVPAELRAKLIIPHLSERTKSLISRLSVSELEEISVR